MHLPVLLEARHRLAAMTLAGLGVTLRVTGEILLCKTPFGQQMTVTPSGPVPNRRPHDFWAKNHARGIEFGGIYLT